MSSPFGPPQTGQIGQTGEARGATGEASVGAPDGASVPRSAFSFGGQQAAYLSTKRPPAGSRSRSRPRGIRAALALVAVLLVGAVLAIALGGGGARQNSDSASLPTPLSQAAYVTARSPGFKFSLTASGAVGGRSFAVDGEGSIDERAGQSAMHFEAAGVQISELIKSPYLYMQLPAEALPTAGKPWIRVNVQSVAHALGLGNPFTQTANPSQILGMLKASGQVQELGSAVVRGTQTTHYRALVDYRRYASQQPGAAGKAVLSIARQLERLTGSDALPVDVWVDAQGRVRRVSTEMKIASAAGIVGETVSMELFGFGPQPAVIVPPAAEVSEETGLFTSGASAARQSLP